LFLTQLDQWRSGASPPGSEKRHTPQAPHFTGS
jgi:hypothetical protein